jgi:hypothetical protein
VENLVDAFGGKFLIERRARFPEMLAFCTKCGIVSTSVLRRLNATRNKVEHEYYIPTGVEASDFVDIVGLFVEATDRLVDRFPRLLELGSADEKCGVQRHMLRIKFTPNTGVVALEASHLTIEEDRWDQLAKARKQELLQELEGDNASGQGKALLVGDIDEHSYRQATKGFWEKQTLTQSVGDGDAYFAWVRLLLEKSK